MSQNFTIKCDETQMKKIEAHCFSETQVEVGGFLVGKIEENVTTVTNVFPAEHSVGASTQLTFTHESWNALYESLNSEPEGTALIGWYHSHPNFGIFLSDHDKFIQQNFFKQDGQITIVVDPIKGRKGWFYSKSGKIEKYKSETNTERPRLGVSDKDSSANIEAMLQKKGGVTLLQVVSISAVMSLLSFVLGFAVSMFSPTSGAVTQDSFSQLQAQVRNIQIMLSGSNPTTIKPKQKVATTPKIQSPPKALTTPKGSLTTKAVKGKPCKKGDTDPQKRLKCNLGSNKATGVWSIAGKVISSNASPSASPTNSPSATPTSSTRATPMSSPSATPTSSTPKP
jgi:proteasome lid subunit RPN8/RPN11